MMDYFTARVCKVESSARPRMAVLQLELQEASVKRLTGVVVLGADTHGWSTGQLRPHEEGLAAHVVLDASFLRRLQPGNQLRVEWETRAKWLMTNIVAVETAPHRAIDTGPDEKRC